MNSELPGEMQHDSFLPGEMHLLEKVKPEIYRYHKREILNLLTCAYSSNNTKNPPPQKKSPFKKSHVSCVTCHLCILPYYHIVIYVINCNSLTKLPNPPLDDDVIYVLPLTPTATATDPPPANSPSMQNWMVHLISTLAHQ